MSEDEETPIRCPRCDWMTNAKKGHIVKDGEVIQCPFINTVVTIKPAPTQDRLV